MRIRITSFILVTGLVAIVFACQSSIADQPNSNNERFPTLKAGGVIYSNVTITAVTATDIYFTHAGGMGNVKLKSLDPELQQRFHFDPKKAADMESQQKKASTAYLLKPVRSSAKKNYSADPDPYISVQAAQVAVQYNYYDPIYGHPSELGPHSPARISCLFTFDADFAVQNVSQNANGPFSFRIESVKVSIGLPMTVTAPRTPVEGLKTYLDSGQRIYEHFYELGSKAADRAARVVGSGRSIVARGSDLESAKSDFLLKAKRIALQEYIKYTETPAHQAITKYNVLTDYSLNLADRNESAQQAIQQCEIPIPED